MTACNQEKKRGVLKNGNPRSNGRRKGSLNKFTTLKKSFLDAFNQTGGTAGLVAWVKENKHNRAVFYQMITRLFPQEVEHSGEIQATLKFEFNGNGNGEKHE